MDYCTERAKKRRWVEKSPDNIRHWELIRQRWHQPILIHVTREYKDTYASWKVRKGASLDRFLESAKSAYDEIRPLLGRETDNYLEVDYLDMVLDTEQTMRRVLDKVGESWDPACAEINLDQTKAEHQKLRGILGRESPTLVSLSKPIFHHSIGQWKRFLTEWEEKRIETELADLYRIYEAKWARVATAVQ